MTGVSELPPDQRAVLELVLARGRNYDQIAQLLAVDRAGVRQRALAALDALAPQTGVAPERRGLITDYLLGQLPAPVSDDVRQRLADSPDDRAWASIVASELATVATEPLPEIPPAATDGAADRTPQPAAADGAADRTPQPAAADGAADRTPRPAAADGAADGPAAAHAAGATDPPAPVASASPGAPRLPRRGSRAGGAFVLGIAALIIAVVLIVVFVIKPGHKATHKAPAATARRSATTTGTPAKPTVLGQIRLTAPNRTSKAQGIAEAFSESGQRLLAVVAINLAPNKSNYYAVWLTNGGSTNTLVGYERVAVSSNGRLQALGPLPANPSRYTRLELTLEPGKPPANGPSAPGKVVLSGPFNVK